MKISIKVAFALFLSAMPFLSIAESQKHIIVGTGGVTGVYYPAGGAVCRMVNRLRPAHSLRCFVESTDGSVYNLQRLRERDLDFAIVQSDWQYHAYNGTGKFYEFGPDKALRTAFSLHSEPFTIVARQDSGIKVLDDLKGKRVNIGNLGSGQRATMEWLMRVLGWRTDQFSEVHEVDSADQAEALCSDRFDAMIFVAGSPNSSVKQATNDCDSVLISVQGDSIEQAMAESGFYEAAIIKGGTYRGNPNDVQTFGVHATFVTTESVDDGVVYHLVRSVFENFNAFKVLHPALQALEKPDMLLKGLRAPVHEGAKRYYREAQLSWKMEN
jgi:TRAP transporter TAXI family solute receptor